MWLKYVMTQAESEFTPKLFKIDVPRLQTINPEKFNHYRKIFDLYSENLSLDNMLENFQIYMKKMLCNVLVSSKARYLLSRLIIIESSTNDMLFDHSFVKYSGRNADFTNSKHFYQLID